MNKLKPGDVIGERRLLEKVRFRGTTHWKCVCSCGTISLCSENNLKKLSCLKCRGHFTNKLKQLGFKGCGSFYVTRVKLFNRFGMCVEWLDDIAEFARIYMQKPKLASMVPINKDKPLGPFNYKFEMPPRPEFDCSKARTKAERFIGDKAWTTSKQYVYYILNLHGVRP